MVRGERSMESSLLPQAGLRGQRQNRHPQKRSSQGRKPDGICPCSGEGADPPGRLSISAHRPPRTAPLLREHKVQQPLAIPVRAIHGQLVVWRVVAFYKLGSHHIFYLGVIVL